MRVLGVATMMLAGCLDFEALYSGSASADLATNGTLDLAGTSGDLGSRSDAGAVDLGPTFYWVSSFAAPMGAKALRGITGAGSEIYAVGDGGTLLRSANSGGTWAEIGAGTATNFTSVWASAPREAWIAGSGGRLFSFDGTTVTSGSMVPNQNYAAVFGVSAQEVIAVGDDQNQASQLRMMNKWQPSAHNLGSKQRGMWGKTNRLWSFGENATGGYYDINTFQWTVQPIAATKGSIAFRAGWGSSDTDVWAVGNEGNISHFAGAAPFQMVPSGVPNQLNGVWGLAPNNLWAVGDGATIVHYDGTSWQKWTQVKDIAGNENLEAIWGNGTNLWTVSDKGNIYRYQ